MSKSISRIIACAAFVFMFASVQPLTAAAGNYSDQDIAGDVSSALESYGYSLDVAVNDGRVTLKGNVPTNDDLATAETRARQVEGVRSVNTFNLGYDSYMSGEGA